MKLTLLLTLIFGLLIWPIAAHAQQDEDSRSILFSGLALRGHLDVIKQQDDVETRQMTAKQSVFPGFEIRFRENRRLGFGVGYHHVEFNPATLHAATLRDPTTREELMGYDLTTNRSGHVLVGTVQINILTRGIVRPFLSMGGGINRYEDASSVVYFKSASQQALTGPPAPPESGSSRVHTLALKGTAGINIRLVKHAIFSLGGGYQNGKVLAFGAGVSF